MNIVKNSTEFIKRIEDGNMLNQEHLNILYRAHVIGSIKGIASFMEVTLTPIISIQTLAIKRVLRSKALFDKRVSGKYVYSIERLKEDRVYLSDIIEQIMEFNFSDTKGELLTHEVLKTMNFAFIDSFLCLYSKKLNLHNKQWKILAGCLLEQLREINPKLQSKTLVYVNTKQILGLKP